MGLIFASIDIGSNAGRLLFANVFEQKGEIIADKASLLRIPLRLGLDVYELGRISDFRKQNLIKTLSAFKLLLDVYNPVGYSACATAAMREASNGKEIIDEVFRSTGIRLQIIDGIEEAKIISSANNMNMHLVLDHSLYIDVGGGSTEITLTRNHAFVASNSFRIGTLRNLAKAVPDGERDKMKQWLDDKLNGIKMMNCIGSGGNINKLTKLYGDHAHNTISYKALKKGLQHLESYSLSDRINKLGLRPDRADVIVPAAKIFLDIMEWTGIQSLTAPKIGLADGLVVKQYEEYISRNRMQR
jgi:exopolyphosphatase / guanosine-5'-triphosphate,3'-diphosphate pyrophosphatase